MPRIPASFCVFLALAAACASPPAEDDTSSEAEVTAASLRPLRAAGEHFVDRGGRVVLLRGVNVSGASKVPPFVPNDDAAALDRLRDLGMNVIRMPFLWEAYEPEAGRYDERYLDAMKGVARDAWSRGLHVIVDFHQDGFSRFSIDGCGSGFPSWVVPPGVGADRPDNSEARCASWGLKMMLDVGMHRSWSAFYRNERGVRDAFLRMTGRVGRARPAGATCTTSDGLLRCRADGTGPVTVHVDAE